MKPNTRGKLLETAVTELARVWIISLLTYFYALAAEIAWLRYLLEISIIGIPLMVMLGLAAVLVGAVSLYCYNRRQWERPAYYAGEGLWRRRLSLTDLRADEVAWLYGTEDAHLLWRGLPGVLRQGQNALTMRKSTREMWEDARFHATLEQSHPGDRPYIPN